MKCYMCATLIHRAPLIPRILADAPAFAARTAQYVLLEQNLQSSVRIVVPQDGGYRVGVARPLYWPHGQSLERACGASRFWPQSYGMHRRASGISGASTVEGPAPHEPVLME